MNYKLVVFDVDGVLLEIESIWRYLHNYFGTWRLAEKNMKLFFQGKITYREWAELDVKLWKGINIDKFYDAINKINIRKYAKELVNYLKEKGLEVVAISAGLDLVAYKLENIGINNFISNTLIFHRNICTGKIIVRVEYSNKDKVLRDACLRMGVSLNKVITIGDSEVDIPMFKIDGLSIAYNPKNLEVAENSDIAIFSNDLMILKETIEKFIS